MLVDSGASGSIRPGETIDLPVAPGRHSVQIAIDWARSPALDVDVGRGETVYLRCAPNAAQPALVGATVGRGRYVSLWRADASDPPPSEDLMPPPWGRLALLALLLTGVGLTIASGRPAVAAALAVFAVVPAVVSVSWVYVRVRRRMVQRR